MRSGRFIELLAGPISDSEQQSKTERDQEASADTPREPSLRSRADREAPRRSRDSCGRGKRGRTRRSGCFKARRVTRTPCWGRTHEVVLWPSAMGLPRRLSRARLPTDAGGPPRHPVSAQLVASVAALQVNRSQPRKRAHQIRRRRTHACRPSNARMPRSRTPHPPRGAGPTCAVPRSLRARETWPQTRQRMFS